MSLCHPTTLGSRLELSGDLASVALSPLISSLTLFAGFLLVQNGQAYLYIKAFALAPPA